ncbi:hypothetical protein K474DRAFT_75159 [Panus rudis PR-1116 ss-1]|nr:hypothetical protein K474DRAFT_75159 [Panus rudis PR-1116 ss-1]
MENPQHGSSTIRMTRRKLREDLESNTIAYRRTIVDILPHELIGDIIDLVVSDHVESTQFQRTQTSFYSWLRSTHVCRRWRQIALHTPKIWRRISVTSQDCVDAMLERSKNTWLQVFATDCWTYRWEEYADLICHLLSARPHRVEGVFLRILPRTKEMVRSRMKDTPMLSLRRIGIYCDGVYHYNIPESFLSPPLRFCAGGIDLRSWLFPAGILPISDATTHLTIKQRKGRDVDMQIEGLLDALQEMPNLQFLDLDHSLKPIGGSVTTSDLATIRLSKLRSLALGGVDMVTTAALLQCLPCLPTTCDVELRLAKIKTRDIEDVFAKNIAEKFAHTPATTLEIVCNFYNKEKILFTARTASNRLLTVSAYSKLAIAGGRAVLSSLLSYFPTSQVQTLSLVDNSDVYHHPLGSPDWWTAVSQQVRNVKTFKIFSTGVSCRILSTLTLPANDSPLPVDSGDPSTQSGLHHTPAQFPFRNLQHLNVTMWRIGEDVGNVLNGALVARRENGLVMPKTVTLHSHRGTSEYPENPFSDVLMSDETYEDLQKIVTDSEGTIERNFCGGELLPWTDEW